jgi:hypothetical protein
VDVSTGLRTGPWKLPVSTALRLEDYRAGIAVYVVGRAVYLLPLAGEPNVTIRAPGPGPVHAQLVPSGLFYSYRAPGSPSRGRVAFVPMGSVLARFA